MEARRWRGPSRILLLSKASLEAAGTRPITSTSYCVRSIPGVQCVHVTFLPFSLSLASVHFHRPSAWSWPARRREYGYSRFLFAPLLAQSSVHPLSLPLSPVQTSIWPSIHRAGYDRGIAVRARFARTISSDDHSSSVSIKIPLRDRILGIDLPKICDYLVSSSFHKVLLE